MPQCKSGNLFWCMMGKGCLNWLYLARVKMHLPYSRTNGIEKRLYMQ